MKRGRGMSEDVCETSLTLASCLMALSRGGAGWFVDQAAAGRTFECKTCNRQFPSFQALGGHRASHKKPRPEDRCSALPRSETVAAERKTHSCSVCGLEFDVGQALGGHMRRHRRASNEDHQQQAMSLPAAKLAATAVRKTGSRRLLCLDLNLTPMENELELRFGKVATSVV